MVRIKDVNLKRLQVKEVGSMAAFVIAKLGVLLLGKYVPQKMVDTITKSKLEFDAAIGSDTNPEQTNELHAKDQTCDDSFQELKGLCFSATLRRQDNIRAAGERVTTAIRHRGYNMQEFRIPVQIDTMTQLINDIKASPELTADVATIGGTEVVVRLTTEVADLKSFWEKTQAGKVTGNLTSAEGTRRMCSSLSQVFQYLDSMSDFEPAVASAIEQINAVIEPYATTIKSRATIRENKKKVDPPKTTL